MTQPARADRHEPCPAAPASAARTVLLEETEIVCDLSGAAYVPSERALLVADLHLEKAASFARRGRMLPPYDTRATLARLADAADRHRPRTIVSLGDAFHDAAGPAGLQPDDLGALRRLMRGRAFVWIEGNHDPAPPVWIGGDRAASLELGGLSLRHEPSPCAAPGELAGHLHPCAKIRARGLSVRRRCFATDGARMILPSFGALTGGLNVLDQAYDGMFGAGLTALMLGERGVYPIEAGALLPDRSRPDRARQDRPRPDRPRPGRPVSA